MINEKKAYNYMNKFHGPLRMSSNGWYDGMCPFCGRHKLAVHFGYKHVKCWRGCFKGFIIDFIRKVEGIPYFEALDLIEGLDEVVIMSSTDETIEESPVELPNGYHSILLGDGLIADRARTFLQCRDFDLDYLDRIGVGYCDQDDKDDNYFGYIIIPLKREGRLVYFLGRDFMGNRLRYKNPPKSKYGVGKGEFYFNEEALYLHNKVYLTEGWADAATMGSMGVSIQGSMITNVQIDILLNSPVSEVVIGMDKGFYTNGLFIASKLLPHKKIKVLNLDRLPDEDDNKDFNDFGQSVILDLEDNTDYIDKLRLLLELRKHVKRSGFTY